MILLRHLEADQSIANIKVILECLGLQSWREITVADLEGRYLTETELGSNREPSNGVLIAPFTVLEFISSYNQQSYCRSLKLPRTIRNVFLHSYKPAKRLEQIVLEMFPDKAARLLNLSPHGKYFRFSHLEDICGPFSGLEIQCDDRTPCWGLVSESSTVYEIFPILQSSGASVLLCLHQEDRNLFMLFTSNLADVEQVVTQNLDVRHYLLSLVAPFMILKHLSQGIGWMPGRSYANIIIDDPPLMLKYGFAEFSKLKQEVVSRGLSMTLAFIPWNYRRGNDRSIAFFKHAHEHISICIHGCNHTKSEFGSSNNTKVNALAALACDRMERFKMRTGLSYSRIMVFPQGSFSSHAMAALKRNQFLAAVNTELQDVTGLIQIKLKDLLQPAIMSYYSFPLFLRRKVSDGIPNLALDLLFNRPCIIVTHHDDFQEDSAIVWQLAESLHKHVEWKSLTHIVTHLTLLKKLQGGKLMMRAFSRVVNLECLDEFPYAQCRLVKRENEPERVKTVLLDGRAVQAYFDDGEIFIEIPERSEARTAEFVFEGDYGVVDFAFLPHEIFAIWLRRFLSEIRDNYFSKSGALLWAMRYASKVFRVCIII